METKNGAITLQTSIEKLRESLKRVHTDIEAVLQAWAEVEKIYHTQLEERGENSTHSFKGWALINLDESLISRVEEWKHKIHHESLAEDKVSLLKKLKIAFKTSIWMLYFVFGENLIKSRMALKGIARIKRVKKDVTLDMILTSLELSSEKRGEGEGTRVSRNTSKFTLHDVKEAEANLCALVLTPTPSLPSRNESPGFNASSPTSSADIDDDKSSADNGSCAGNLSPNMSRDSSPKFLDESDIEVEFGRGASKNNLAYDGSSLLLSIESLDGLLQETKPHPNERLRERSKSAREQEPERSQRGLGNNIESAERLLDLSPRKDNQRDLDFVGEVTDSDYFDETGAKSDSNSYSRGGSVDLDDTTQFHIEINDGIERNMSQKDWGIPGELRMYKRVTLLNFETLSELNNGRKLTDTTLNYWLHHLFQSSIHAPKIFSQTTFFYENLESGPSENINYSAVSKWTTKINCTSLQDASYLMIPIFDRVRKHWLLILGGSLTPGNRLFDSTGAADKDCSRIFITVIDSLSPWPGNLKFAENIKDYISQEAESKFGLRLSQEFTQIKHPRHVILQTNTTDCGIHVLEHARRFLEDPIMFFRALFQTGFAGFDAQQMRHSIAQSIIRQKKQQDIDDGILAENKTSLRPPLENMSAEESRIHNDVSKQGKSSDEEDATTTLSPGENFLDSSHNSLALEGPSDDFVLPLAVNLAPNSRKRKRDCTKAAARKEIDRPRSLPPTFSYELPHFPEDRGMEKVSATSLINLLIQKRHLNLPPTDIWVKEGKCFSVERDVWLFVQNTLEDPSKKYMELSRIAISRRSLKAQGCETQDQEYLKFINEAHVQYLKQQSIKAQLGIMSGESLREVIEQSLVCTNLCDQELEKSLKTLPANSMSASVFLYMASDLQITLKKTAKLLEELLEFMEGFILGLDDLILQLNLALTPTEGEE